MMSDRCTLLRAGNTLYLWDTENETACSTGNDLQRSLKVICSL